MLGPNDFLGDLETRSRTDLKKSGARRYAADPTTCITTASWIFRGVRKNLSTIHPFLGTHAITDLYDDLRQAAASGGRTVFHNANFDISVLTGLNPFFNVPLSAIDCTMGRAQAVAMPGGLDDLCAALGVKGKDPRGKALVMATCKPMRNGLFNEDVQTHRELLEYNDEDREALMRVDELLPPLSAAERKVFERTWRKNSLGLPIDVHLATAIAIRREEIEIESQAELRELTQNAVTKVTQRKRILNWANGGNRAAGLEGTKKHEVAEALADENLHPDVRRVLEILQQDGGSAPLKAQALLDRHVSGWYKDATRFFGARSGRGTSEGANMFNIARPSGKYNIEEVIAGLKAGFIKYNNTALTDCLRGCIVAPDGYLIADNDESNAELRIALWQAGDTDRLGILAKNGDLYMYNAIQALPHLPKDANKNTHPKERQTFKSVTLGGNYQLGWRTYMAFLIKTAAENGLKREDITDTKAQQDIMGYRRANPLLQQLWFNLADAFKQCIYDHPSRIFTAGKIAFQKDQHGTIWMLLPSGRAIPHYNAHISYDGEMAFYRAKYGMMLRQKAFGGSLLEISCQAMTRDIITASEEDIENELPDVHLILDVYDSILALVPKHNAEERSEQIRQIMSRPRSWTSGLPIGAEGYVHTRMKK